MAACSIPLRRSRRPRRRRRRRAVANLGRSLKLHTVAEGVETGEQLTRIRDLGCELAQGYLFSRSRPPHPRSTVEMVVGSGS
jgi:EAL domain-containing protein (putative c-di-GMP-specific phosphodiesterase class I)